jgi:hypothetical protein
MCLTTLGITDFFFNEGWRTAAQDKTIACEIIIEYEEHGYFLTEPPEPLHDFQIKGNTRTLSNLFNESVDRYPSRGVK